VTLLIDNWRWARVPFSYARESVGARSSKDRHPFKPVPHRAFKQHSVPQPTVLRLQLDPDCVSLEININGPGDPFNLDRVELDMTLGASSPTRLWPAAARRATQ
jgi:glucose-6-phosphate 1-dehydrogenase